MTNSNVLSKHSQASFLLKIYADLVSLKYSLAFPNLTIPSLVSNIILLFSLVTLFISGTSSIFIKGLGDKAS